MIKKDKFVCSECGITFKWFMKGGTNKMIGNPIEYSNENETKCCYCKFIYPDGTNCIGGKRK